MKYEKIKLAIKSGLFAEEMCEIVSPPTEGDINGFQSSSGFVLGKEHIELLLSWGGSNLDEIRINGLAGIACAGGFVEFANDYNGFVYKYNSTGQIYVEDTDGGKEEVIANSVSEFINDFFLGELGMEFYGEDWVLELKELGLA